MKIKTEFLLPALVLFSNHCQAFDWLLQPDFSATERYTDNLRMQITPTRDNLITTLSPGLLLGYIAENQELKTSFKWNELIYHGESELDFSEKIANASHQFNAERFKTDLSAQYAEQSSINTQLDPEGSGNLQIQVPRTTRSVSPGITYNLTEQNAVQLGYNYVDVKFDTTESLADNLGFSDYDNQQFSATFIHTYSERLSFNLTGAYSKFNSSNDSSNSRSFITFIPAPPFLVGLNQSRTTSYEQSSTTLFYQAGLQYLFDEQTQFSLSAGMRETENRTRYSQIVTFNPEYPPYITNPEPTEINDTSTASGHVFSANLTRNSEWGGFTLNAGQQLNPSSSGSQQQSTTFSANLRYNLSERWTTGVTASYLMSESTSTLNNNSNISNNRTYTTLTPNIRWRWTPEINLELSYSYRQQEFDALGQTAIGNNLQLQFSYQPLINRQVK
ncbi:hypothetical protein IVG45_08095 [Methylomonas sp. LL1]|uniref:hypothetical protein n=1 Tax=Methylomonas sp. LL1 TaxID=2785785 RepID=UPI0018C38A47|nr:hypothetical protein [Methylomonas sp. LL1]QPK64886.1 hypothetical protein IVG45_08095 [Methylomonas sp. LL1]